MMRGSLWRKRCFRTVAIWLTLCIAGGCSHWQHSIISGANFDHAVITAHTAQNSQPLHIYIHGDGRPFLTPTTVAANPSGHRPYVLKLMRQDPQPNVMLGRPCYFQQPLPHECTPWLWTQARYSAEVIQSMVRATNSLANQRDVVLIGFSGGGTIAMLMAPAIQNLVGIITIAANLDIDEWADTLGYTPMTDSLNPMDHLWVTNHIPQLHFFGDQDKVVPRSMAEHIAGPISPANIRIMQGYTHSCCWHDNWPDLLNAAIAHLTQATRTAQNASPR